MDRYIRPDFVEPPACDFGRYYEGRTYALKPDAILFAEVSADE